MKKIQSLALALFATLSLASCSNEEPAGGQDTSNGETRYLSVNIVPTSADGSRAATEDLFENGTEKENTVTKVRFYFFTSGGDAAKVKYDGGTYKNYYDWTNTDEDKKTETSKPDGSNVEKVLNPVIVISTPAGDKLPDMVLAVINPDDAGLDMTTNYTLTALRNIYKDYATSANADKFVMSNSVYASGTEVIKATKLQLSDFKKTEVEAKGSPVDIYVERCVAKVRASYNTALKFENGLLPALNNSEEKKPITIHGEGEEDIPVYIKIEGWNLTYYMPAANLSKHIVSSWSGDILGSKNWNDSKNFRSYWADQNSINNQKHRNISWNAAKALGFGTNGTKKNTTYANENAERNSDSGLEPTQIMVAATLCKKDGTPLNVCHYAGLKFADDESFTNLKSMFLSLLNESTNKFYQKIVKTEGEVIKTTYKKIEAADITFKQNKDAEKDMYTASAVLTEDAEKYTWVTSTASTAAEITNDNQVTPSDKDAVNAALKGLTPATALIYKNGATYYFAPIDHYSKHGIVRNHIYNITVDGFYGLGTPVYDPDWNIILEKPKSDAAYLAARINILSWHLINNNITFN